MNIEPSIFKAYDIRGLYPQQLNEEVAKAIAKGFASLLIQENPGKELKVGLSRDMRLSSPSIREAVIVGLTEGGLDVVDLGMQATPIFYFGVGHLGLDGGIQISASHNGPAWNGLKMVRSKSRPISGYSGIKDIQERSSKEDFLKLDKIGSVESHEGIDLVNVQEHIKYADVVRIKPMKVAIDAANAMGISQFGELFNALPQLTVEKINWFYDGSFPAHEADPMVAEYLRPTQDLVLSTGADLGLVPDGDGDRIFFIDEKGQVVPSEFIRGLLAQDVIKKHPDKKIAYDIRPGKITADMIEEVGGTAEITPVGHSLIKEQMIKNDLFFGGESSGHYFYRTEQGTFECQMVAVMKVMEYMSVHDKPLSELVAPYKKYFNSGEINTKVASREVVEQKLAQIKQLYSDGKQNEIDGITIEYPDVWFTVRPSNTEPVLRLIVEARSQGIMEKYKKDIVEIINS